jgi:hypothetical protein
MTHRNRWASLATASSLLLVAQALAVAPEIRDEGKLFSAEAIKKADEHIAEINRKYDRDLLIETFASAPAADVEKVKAMEPKERDEYFTTWAKDRAQKRVVRGVYVMICKEPHILRVGVVEPQPHKFPAGTQAAIDEALKKELKDGHFDGVLEKALKIVEDRLAPKAK